MFHNSRTVSIFSIIFISVILISISLMTCNWEAADSVSVMVNGSRIMFPDQQPYISSQDRCLVPVRFISQELNGDVQWYEEQKVVSLEFASRIVIMKVGQSECGVNGQVTPLDSPAQISGDRIYVPLRFISEALGLTVSWNDISNTVNITGDPNNETPITLEERDASDTYLQYLLQPATIPSGNLPDLGPNANLNGYRLFPPDNPWNQRIDNLPADPNSDRILARMGLDRTLKADFGANWNGGPFGIPYIVVSGDTPRVAMSFEYADESDPGPYPIPADAPIENGSDRHILVLDRDNQKLYETWNTWPSGNSCYAGSGAIFDLTSNSLRPTYWTSADAAGLPILPGLVRYDEVMEQGRITHALRVTVDETRHAFIAPATHFADDNTDPYLPPMGARIRLRQDYDISSFPPAVQVVLQCLKEYGMLVADDGASYYISGAPDARWNDEELASIQQVTGADLEIVQMGPMITDYQ